jgi:hypothetical protein
MLPFRGEGAFDRLPAGMRGILVGGALRFCTDSEARKEDIDGACLISGEAMMDGKPDLMDLALFALSVDPLRSDWTEERWLRLPSTDGLVVSG